MRANGYISSRAPPKDRQVGTHSFVQSHSETVSSERFTIAKTHVVGTARRSSSIGEWSGVGASRLNTAADASVAKPKFALLMIGLRHSLALRCDHEMPPHIPTSIGPRRAPGSEKTTIAVMPSMKLAL